MSLSGDPRDGTRRAFLALHPNATDTDWERWESKLPQEPGRETERFEARAALCNNALEMKGDVLEPAVSRHIAYSAGYYEAIIDSVSILASEAFASRKAAER
jgi:hypothetical protein